MSVRVILADDHQIVLDGLRTLLTLRPGFEVVAEARTGRVAVELSDQHHPDVVVMDINMPDLNGIEAARRILSREGRTRVIALSMHLDQRMVAEMLRAGAAGYLLKDCAFEELTQAIETVLAGHIYLSPGIADNTVTDYLHRATQTDDSAFSLLSQREREVLQLLSEGKTTKQIASLLHLGVKTVETHRQQLMKKLQIHSVPELTKYAIQQGLTTLEF